MSWAAAAVVGASVVSSAVSSRSASKASKRASKDAQNELAFAQAQYNDWMAVYGPIQDNLSAYYGNITPEYYEAIGLEAIEGEYEVIRTDLERSLAQRGIEDSGLALSLEKDIAIQEAEAKADIRRTAPAMAAEEQSRFLQIGMGSDPSSSVSTALARRSNVSQQIAAESSKAAGEAIGSTVETIGTGLSDYFASKEK